MAEVELRDAPVEEKDELDYVKEGLAFLRLCVPIMVSQGCTFLVAFTSLIFTGRFFSDSPSHGVHEIEAVGLGTVLTNLTGFSLIYGVLSPSETLGPHAFGAKQYAEVGIVMLRSAIACLVAFLLVVVVWWFLGDIVGVLHLPGATPPVVAHVTVFLRWSIPYIFSMSVAEIARRVMLVQSIVVPYILLQLVCVCLHPLVLTATISMFDFTGVPIGISITMTIQASLGMWYVYRGSAIVPATLPPLTMEGLREACAWEPMVEFWKLAAGGLVSMCEWWYFETATFFCLSFGEVASAAYSLSVQMVMLGFMMPLGVSIGLSTRVGQLLGGGRVNSAKQLTAAVMSLGNGVVIGHAVFVYILRQWIWGMYDVNPLVEQQLDLFWFAFCIFLWTNGNVALIRGLYCGLGQQVLFGVISAVLLVVGLAFVIAFTAWWPRGMELPTTLSTPVPTAVASGPLSAHDGLVREAAAEHGSILTTGVEPALGPFWWMNALLYFAYDLLLWGAAWKFDWDAAVRAISRARTHRDCSEAHAAWADVDDEAGGLAGEFVLSSGDVASAPTADHREGGEGASGAALSLSPSAMQSS